MEALAQLLEKRGEGAEGRVLFVFAEEATPEFYRASFPAVERGCALAALLDFSGGVKVEFRHEEREPLSFDALADFLSGASGSVRSASFHLFR